MSEVQVEVKTYEVHFECDLCGDGCYLPTGEMFPTNPPRYEHACETCKSLKSFSVEYPIVRYKRIREESWS